MGPDTAPLPPATQRQGWITCNSLRISIQMSLPSAQIQSIGKTARANAEAGAPAILDPALLEDLGISAKEQNFSLTGNVG